MANKHTRAFQEHCRSKVLQGFINGPDGQWRPADGTRQMDLDMQAGYRIAGRLKRARKQKAT